MYGTSGTMLKLPVLTAERAAELTASEGFPSRQLQGETATYAKNLIDLLERTTDAEMRESIAFALALITGVDTGEPATCVGCKCFTGKAYLRGGLCPDCDGEGF
jgi:hypothetical protein